LPVVGGQLRESNRRYFDCSKREESLCAFVRLSRQVADHGSQLPFPTLVLTRRQLSSYSGFYESHFYSVVARFHIDLGYVLPTLEVMIRVDQAAIPRLFDPETDLTLIVQPSRSSFAVFLASVSRAWF
jgi:hypothetical protein